MFYAAASIKPFIVLDKIWLLVTAMNYIAEKMEKYEKKMSSALWFVQSTVVKIFSLRNKTFEHESDAIKCHKNKFIFALDFCVHILFSSIFYLALYGISAAISGMQSL